MEFLPHVFWVVQLEFSKLVVFDVDGTLNQTERYAIAAYRKALEELGRDGFTDEELKQRIGAPFSEDLKFFFGADQKYQSIGLKVWRKMEKLFREQKRCWIV